MNTENSVSSSKSIVDKLAVIINYGAAAEKHYAFRGLELSLLEKKEVRFFPAGSSHCAFPQDKEGYGSIASHEENWS
ncbi:hypothetical protein J2Z83_002240 [Virgibacillus natechei]|uniref:Uncharacterized protein n=1 Tax=Virgibacillus natechei TaxID=1216297 RepID=A0ABS4IGP9_9BACI|nr:hypothetical protein [Virgibacillus natechei]